MIRKRRFTERESKELHDQMMQNPEYRKKWNDLIDPVRSTGAAIWIISVLAVLAAVCLAAIYVDHRFFMLAVAVAMFFILGIYTGVPWGTS